MAKHIVEENIILTTFAANEASAKKVEESVERLANKERREAIKSQRTTQEAEQKKTEAAEKAAKKTADTVVKESNRSTTVVVKNNNRIKESYRRAFSPDFITSLERAFVRLERLAVRLTIATTAFAYGLERTVKAQRDLYYASERLEVPVEDINRYQYVVSMLGGNLEQALPSLERFKNTLQDMALGRNAAALEIFGRLGLTQFDSTGRVKSVTQAMEELATAIRRLPSVSTQTNYLRKLGFDENQFGYFIHDTQQLNEEFTQLYGLVTKGATTRSFLDNLAASSEQVYRRFLRLRTIASVLQKGFLANLNPRLIRLLDNFTKSILANSDAIQRGLKGVSDAAYTAISLFLSLITTVGKLVLGFSDWYSSLNDAEKNLLKFAATVGLVFKILGRGMLASPFGRLLAGISLLGLMIQDYLYYKKALEEGDDKYKYHYNWPAINESMTKNLGFNIDDIDISGKIRAIGEALSFVAEKFSEIDPALRNFVISIGLISTALLPVKSLLVDIGKLLGKGTGVLMKKGGGAAARGLSTAAKAGLPIAGAAATAALPALSTVGALGALYLALRPKELGNDTQASTSILQGSVPGYQQEAPSKFERFFSKIGDFLYNSASEHSIFNAGELFSSWNEPLGASVPPTLSLSPNVTHTQNNTFNINSDNAGYIANSVADRIEQQDMLFFGNPTNLNFPGLP